MKLRLERSWDLVQRTIGRLYVDGAFECYTCEDRVRTGPKVYGETAIPKGTYDIAITMSERFKDFLPLLKDVPGFQGIRIHAGNTEKDTLGCILVGAERDAEGVYGSQKALGRLLPKMKAAVAQQEPITIEIV